MLSLFLPHVLNYSKQLLPFLINQYLLHNLSVGPFLLFPVLCFKCVSHLLEQKT